MVLDLKESQGPRDGTVYQVLRGTADSLASAVLVLRETREIVVSPVRPDFLDLTDSRATMDFLDSRA